MQTDAFFVKKEQGKGAGSDHTPAPFALCGFIQALIIDQAKGGARQKAGRMPSLLKVFWLEHMIKEVWRDEGFRRRKG